jgi:hypothetical protein
MMAVAAHAGAGVRKPPMEETAGGVARARQTLWGPGGCGCECNFCDTARTLRMGENTYRRFCNFKELRVVRHILQLVRYVPDGNLCTASAEEIFPRDSVQLNCFELALYTMRDHDCISNRIGLGIRNCPRCRCRLATFGAPPTPSMINRAIIMLNDRRFWGDASGPSSSGKTLPSFHPLLAPPCCSPQRPTARAV